MATIEVFDRLLKWADDSRFAIGKTVVLSVKVQSQTRRQPSCSRARSRDRGEHQCTDRHFNPGDPHTTSPTGWRNRKARVMLQQKDSDAISSVNGQAGSGLTADIDATTEVRDHIFQDNVTDWDFICRLARRNGMVVFSDGTKLSVKKPASLSTEIALAYGVTLHEFRPVLKSTGQVNKVTVRGWDPATKAAVVGQSQSTDSGAQKLGWGSTGAALSQSGIATSEVLVSDVPIKQADGDAIAKATLSERWRRDIVGEGIAEGNPAIVPGTWLNVSKSAPV
jgi:phage protein D